MTGNDDVGWSWSFRIRSKHTIGCSELRLACLGRKPLQGKPLMLADVDGCCLPTTA